MNRLSIRKAKSSDSKTVYKLSQEPLVRNTSFKKKKFSFLEHNAWYMKKILSSTSYIWLLNRRSTVYGMIRFDIERKDFVLSYAIFKRFRGKGYGKSILIKGINKINKIYIRPKIIAVTKKNNIISQKCLISANFKLKSAKKNKLIYYFKNIK